MRRHCSTLADKVAVVEVVKLGESLGDTHALNDTQADTHAEVEA